MNALAFSNDGKLLAAASGVTGLRGTVVLWNPENGKRLREFGKSHRDILYDVAISPNANLLASASYDRMIKLWNRKDGKLIRTFSGHNGAVHDIAFSPDGTVLASAGGDSSIKLWKVSTGQRLDTFGQPTGELEERSKRPTFRALEIQWGGRFVMGQVALPIFRDGEVIGAGGVGGGTPEEDEICAASGISTL